MQKFCWQCLRIKSSIRNVCDT